MVKFIEWGIAPDEKNAHRDIDNFCPYCHRSTIDFTCDIVGFSNLKKVFRLSFYDKSDRPGAFNFLCQRCLKHSWCHSNVTFHEQIQLFKIGYFKFSQETILAFKEAMEQNPSENY